LNIAEGYSRYGKKEKLNYLRISKGSLFECVACLDILKQFEAMDQHHYKQMIQGMAEIGKMLSGLIRKIEEFDR
ncbi:MAG: four helix bundle protein, partial [Bdellovibrionales bacterium]|nr:four helix bundle protein [Bdellovibrionales bacterium]